MILTRQHKVSRMQLSRLVKQGKLERVARGLYIAADTELTEHHSLVEACCQIPRWTFCLFSTLSFF